MKILGIETSCDETAASVVEDGRHILSNAVVSQMDEHRLYGGVVPEIASRRHVEQISYVTKAALDDAGLDVGSIDAIAVTHAPGLIGALLVGVNFAKGLSYAIGKPLIAVHHLRGHVASLYLSHGTLRPPFVAMAASGGHSHLVEVKGYTEFGILGRSIDDAAGEAFDKVARALGLGYPGGPAIAQIASNADKDAYKLPDPKTLNPLDVSFSGLKTAVINIINQSEMKGVELSKAGLAAAFQWRAAEMLTERLIKAAKEKGMPAALCGGVAVNETLRSMVSAEASKHSIEVFFAANELCSDNAAMIASAGYYELLASNTADMTLNAYASRSIEESL